MLSFCQSQHGELECLSSPEKVNLRCTTAVSPSAVSSARQEPGTGEIRFDYLFSEFDRMGYSGWIGCDYHPSTHGEEHLGWVRRYL